MQTMPVIRAQGAVLHVAAVIAFLVSYLHMSDYRLAPRAHDHELYHYLIGAKYFGALRYDGLYDATVLALREGERQSGATSVRDLADTENLLPVARAAERGSLIRDAMGDAQWAVFREDILFFDSRFAESETRWADVLKDHGYNPSPSWAIYGSFLPAVLDLQAVYRVSPLLDIAILLLCSIVLARSLGARRAPAFFAAFWIFVAFFPGGLFSISGWVIGSYLRFTWILFLAIGFTLLGRNRAFLAGAFMASAAMERVFPAAFTVAAGLCLVAQLFAGHGEARAHLLRELLRFSGGTLAAILLWIGASTAMYGADSWRLFSGHIVEHGNSYAYNKVGFRNVAVYSPEIVRNDMWSLAGTPAPALNEEEVHAKAGIETRALNERLGRNHGAQLGALAVALFALVLVPRAFRLPSATAISGFSIIFLFSSPSHYYYSFLILILWSCMLDATRQGMSSAPQRALGWWLVSMAGCTVATRVTADWPALTVSVIITYILLGCLLSLISCAASRVSRQVLSLAAGALVMGALFAANSRTSNADALPEPHARVRLSLSAESMGADRAATVSRTYMDAHGFNIRETGVILGQGGAIRLTVPLEFVPEAGLDVIARVNTNYRFATAVTVNGQFTAHQRSIPTGVLFHYLKVHVPPAWLNAGANELVLSIAEGEGVGIHHIWIAG